MSVQPPRLVQSELIDLPVLEASGLAVRHTSRGTVLLVIGDRTTELGVCRIGADGALDNWETIDLATLPGWPLPAGDSQFESIAADGGSLVALMCEDPPIVLVADTETREVCAEIELTAPTGSLLDGQWDDASSRGEGLVLLRGGRLLVAQEKRPRALIEFGPLGSSARGLSTADFLGPDESWEAPSGRCRFRAAVDVEAEGPRQGCARRHQRDRSRRRREPVVAERQVATRRSSCARRAVASRRRRGSLTSTRSGTFPMVW